MGRVPSPAEPVSRHGGVLAVGVTRGFGQAFGNGAVDRRSTRRGVRPCSATGDFRADASRPALIASRGREDREARCRSSGAPGRRRQKANAGSACSPPPRRVARRRALARTHVMMALHTGKRDKLDPATASTPPPQRLLEHHRFTPRTKSDAEAAARPHQLFSGVVTPRLANAVAVASCVAGDCGSRRPRERRERTSCPGSSPNAIPRSPCPVGSAIGAGARRGRILERWAWSCVRSRSDGAPRASVSSCSRPAPTNMAPRREAGADGGRDRGVTFGLNGYSLKPTREA